jgi:hypothetical protein
MRAGVKQQSSMRSPALATRSLVQEASGPDVRRSQRSERPRDASWSIDLSWLADQDPHVGHSPVRDGLLFAMAATPAGSEPRSARR